MTRDDILFSYHALQRCSERGITIDEVVRVLQDGVVIGIQRVGPKAQPRERRLGWLNRGGVRKPVHVMSATDRDGKTTVITVYWPDPNMWNATFTRRK